MKSTVTLFILLVVNILSPLATLMIDYKTTDEPVSTWLCFALLGIVISVINNKLRPKWLNRIFPCLFFLLVCITVHLVGAKIESDPGDMRLEKMGANYSPGQGFPALTLFVAIPSVFLSATTYLVTQRLITAVFLSQNE
jgi:FtsH-binding integral membrane protein